MKSRKDVFGEKFHNMFPV